MEKEKRLSEAHATDSDDAGHENRRHWHIGREIPVALVVLIITQTVAVVWWAASTSAQVNFMKEANVAAHIVQTAIDRRQDDDAQRQENRILVQLDKINVKLDQLADKVRR